MIVVGVRRNSFSFLVTFFIFGPQYRRTEPRFFPKGGLVMPLFEIETPSHIVITWADDEEQAQETLYKNYPSEEAVRITKRPRDVWVISKAVLGITGKIEASEIARECLSKAAGDKLHAIRLYMQQTGSDLDNARKTIESNLVYGW